MLAGTVATKDYSPRATKIESTASAAQGTLKCTPAGSTGIIQAFLAHPVSHDTMLTSLHFMSPLKLDLILYWTTFDA